MSVEILQPNTAGIARARNLLLDGRYVSVPTYRWYLVVMRGDRKDLSSEIYRVKGRARSEALLCLVRDLPHARELVELPHVSKGVARRWPEGLAVRAPKRSCFGIPPAVSADIALVGCPSSVSSALASGNELLIATSINRTGDWPPTSVEQVLGVAKELDLDLAAVICGPGVTSPRVPLTILDCTNKSPRIERQGALLEADVRRLGWL